MRQINGKRQQLGYEGETIVASLLPGAIHLNAECETREPVDVLWNGVSIDVKATKTIYGTEFAYWSAPRTYGTGLDIIYIKVFIADDCRFWIQRASERFKYCHRIPTGLKADDLKAEIEWLIEQRYIKMAKEVTA